MKKKVLSLITAAFLAAGLLAGCGSDAAQGTGAESAARRFFSPPWARNGTDFLTPYAQGAATSPNR